MATRSIGSPLHDLALYFALYLVFYLALARDGAAQGG